MNYKKTLILLFFVVVFIYMAIINFYMPLWADDWCRPITNFNVIDILKYVYNIYFHWSGRVVVYFFGSFFPLGGMVNIGIFDIINSLFFVALIYFIFLLTYSKSPKDLVDLTALLLIFALVWFMPITFGEVMFWKSASPVYLWSITAALIFIYPYKKLLENTSKVPDNFVAKFLFFVLGVFLGTWLENLSLAVCVLLAGILCYEKVKHKIIPGWAYAGACGYVLGTVLLIVAPGNYARLNVSHHIAYFHLSLLQKIFMLSGQIMLHFLPFALIYLVVLFVRRKFGLKNNRVELKWFYVFFVLSLLSAVVMGGAPGALFYGRTTFISDVFAIIATVSLIPLDRKDLFKKTIWPLLALIILPLQIFDMVKTYKFYYRLHDQVVRRETLIKSMMPYNKNISVAPIYFSRQINTFNTSGVINVRRLFASDITTDSTEWRNSYLTKIYDLESIKIVSDLVFSDTLPKMKTGVEPPFIATLNNNKIYYVNASVSCDNIRNKRDFLLNVYPKNGVDNKFYAINEVFNLRGKKTQIKVLLDSHKNPLVLLSPKLWINWQDMKSNFNDFSFTWGEAKRATVLTKDFRPVNNVCVIMDYLPDYPIDHIETGQIKDGKLLWQTILRPNNS